MVTTRASLCLLAVFVACPRMLAARPLNVNFTISNTNGFNGVDPASLTLSGGALSGSVSVITPDGTFPCAVNAGSTDRHARLRLTCTIGPEEMVTLSGTLNVGTGLGHGKFAETFFRENGTYAAVNAR